MMSQELAFFNGIDGSNGQYLSPPLDPAAIARMARDEPHDRSHLAALKQWLFYRSKPTAGLVFGYDPTDLAEAGWGIVFSAQDERTPAIKAALHELLVHRRAQAARQRATFYREFVGADGYRPGESKIEFLARHGADVVGAAHPAQVPYYLLLVGSPGQIPYRFQYQLDVQYAVGRVFFETIEEYAQYAHSVVMAETGYPTLSRQVVLFGTRHTHDVSTRQSADDLIKPLAHRLEDRDRRWEINSILGQDATRARLAQYLGGADTPALLFTATHGMAFPDGDPRQRPHQGALLCQDWPGPLGWASAIPQDFYCAADDVSESAKLHGLISFHFACYGLGTPGVNDLAYSTADTSTALAQNPFLSRLPQRLLSHPKGGALAVIGHIDRAWAYSFLWERATHQLNVFESTLKRLLAGQPVGYALEEFNRRYAELSSELTSELDLIRKGRVPQESTLAGLWLANNDARSYGILGDPAVRLRTV